MPVHRVVLPLFDGFQPLDVTGPHDVLTSACGAENGVRYEVTLVAREPGPVRSAGGLQIVATAGLPETGTIGTLLVPGGPGSRTAVGDPDLVAWLGRAARRAQRVASVCTGAFLLAAAGLLDGVPTATHWRWADALQRRFPAVDVRPDPIHVRCGRIWTSAGVTAGIDLALALLEADHGPEVAQLVAREMVVFLRRAGGQSQFAAPVWADPAPRPSVRAAQDLIHADPAADLRIPVLAAHVGMSERHFGREFTRLLGCPPGDYVEQVRVDTARRLLESEPLLVGVAAARAGFGSAETMRRAFLRRLGVPPDHYRRHFAATTTREDDSCRSPSRSSRA
ncbi:DJ-1/PfpI family protein [Pseudonocardia sp.]|uniref:GlxA family transcriptional regulator n=1 Tax=Pseudonocardia sp. TaxID=60912 RepID=UPI00260AF874|nr:DJ-1/PfpI family protein [Pseudonocardia sp.]